MFDVQTLQESYSSMTVESLKLLIENTFGVPMDQVRLAYMEEKDLGSDRHLFDYHIVRIYSCSFAKTVLI